MLISYVMGDCPVEAGEDYDPALLGPCKANCQVCAVSACPYDDQDILMMTVAIRVIGTAQSYWV